MSQDQTLMESVLFSLDQLEPALASWEGKPNDEEASRLRMLLDSVYRVSRETKDAHADVDWRRLNALRNAFLHDYLGLSAPGIRDFLLGEIPRLRNVATTLIEGKEQESKSA